jgi:hypothetical protein
MEHSIGRGTGAPYGVVISTREGNVGALAPLIPFCINTETGSRNSNSKTRLQTIAQLRPTDRCDRGGLRKFVCDFYNKSVVRV